MGRLICVVLLGCMAVASAVPLLGPGPTSEEELMNIILNAKPEFNDIDFNHMDSQSPDEGLTGESQESQPELSDGNIVEEISELLDNVSALENSQETSQNVPQEQEELPTDSIVPEEDFDVDPTEASMPVPDENQQPEALSHEDHIQVEQEGELQNEPIMIIPLYEDEPSQTDEEETPLIVVAAEQLVPVEPQEDSITIEEDGEIIVLPIEEQPVLMDAEEEISPINEEVLPVSSDDELIIVDINPEQLSDDQVSGVEDYNNFSGVIAVEPEEGLRQPDYFDGEPQSDVAMPPFEPHDSIFGSFAPLGAEEMSASDEAAERPLYFDIINVPDHAQYGDAFMTSMPVEQSPPFATFNMHGVQMIDPSVFIPNANLPFPTVDGESDSTFDDYSVFRAPQVYPQVHPQVYDSNLPIEDNKYENTRMDIPLVDQEEVRPESESLFQEFSPEQSIPTNLFASDDVESSQDSKNSMIGESSAQIDDGQLELEKVGTLVVIEEQTVPEEVDMPTLQIIPLEDSSVLESMPLEPFISDIIESQPIDSFNQEDLTESGAQQGFANDQGADLTDDEASPFIIEETYWIPESGDQHPIIFPQVMPDRETLPVFPSQWRDNDIVPDMEEAVFPNSPSLFDEVSSYGPIPVSESSNGPFFRQEPIMEQQDSTMFNLPSDEMPSANLDITHSSDIPPREEIVPIYDTDSDYVGSGHFHLPEGFTQNFRYPSFWKRFSRPISYGLPSELDVSFQQDYRGPNTFPLNFRPDFNSQVPSYYNSYNGELTPQSSNQRNIFSNSAFSTQNIPKFLTNSPNTFPGVNDQIKMFINADGLKNSHAIRNSDNFNQDQQQFDTLVAFVPYGNAYDVPSYYHNYEHNYRYPYPQQARRPTFDTYQDYSYNVPAYGGSDEYPSVEFYSSPSAESRYGMSYDNERQNDYYNRYNFPVPTW